MGWGVREAAFFHYPKLTYNFIARCLVSPVQSLHKGGGRRATAWLSTGNYESEVIYWERNSLGCFSQLLLEDRENGSVVEKIGRGGIKLCLGFVTASATVIHSGCSSCCSQHLLNSGGSTLLLLFLLLRSSSTSSSSFSSTYSSSSSAYSYCFVSLGGRARNNCFHILRPTKTEHLVGDRFCLGLNMKTVT